MRPLLSTVSPPRIPRELSAVWLRAEPRRRLTESAPRRAPNPDCDSRSRPPERYHRVPVPIPRNDPVPGRAGPLSTGVATQPLLPIAVGRRSREAVRRGCRRFRPSSPFISERATDPSELRPETLDYRSVILDRDCYPEFSRPVSVPSDASTWTGPSRRPDTRGAVERPRHNGRRSLRRRIRCRSSSDGPISMTDTWSEQGDIVTER